MYKNCTDYLTEIPENVFLKSYFGIIPGAMKSEKVASLLP